MSEHDDYDDLPRVDERLADWVDGRLSERDTERLLAEARVNPALREQMRRYQEGVMALRAALAADAPNVDVADRVIAALAQRAAAEAAGPRRTPRSLLWAVVAAAALLGLTFLIDGWASQPRERLEARRATPELQEPAGEAVGLAPAHDALEGDADSKRSVELLLGAQSADARQQPPVTGAAAPSVASATPAAPAAPAESPAPAAANPDRWGDLSGAHGVPLAGGGGAGAADPSAAGSPPSGSPPSGTETGARTERDLGADAGAFVGLQQGQPTGRPEAGAAEIKAGAEQRDARPGGRTRGAPNDRAKAVGPGENPRGLEEEPTAMRRLGSTTPKIEVAALVLVASPAPVTKSAAPVADKQVSPMAAASALLVAAVDDAGRAAASASLAAQGVRVTQWSVDEVGRSVWVLDGESASIASAVAAIAAEARAAGLAWRPDTVAVSAPPRLAPEQKRIVIVLPKR